MSDSEPVVKKAAKDGFSGVGLLINCLIASLSALGGAGVGATTTAGSVQAELREFKAVMTEQFSALRNTMEDSKDEVIELRKNVQEFAVWRAKHEAACPGLHPAGGNR